jgi:hypothetical protein
MPTKNFDLPKYVFKQIALDAAKIHLERIENDDPKLLIENRSEVVRNIINEFPDIARDSLFFLEGLLFRMDNKSMAIPDDGIQSITVSLDDDTLELFNNYKDAFIFHNASQLMAIMILAYYMVRDQVSAEESNA